MGASIGLSVAGSVVGATTVAAFRPILSRHRGLNSVGAVEPTTGLPLTFLDEPGQLNHLVNMLVRKQSMATHFYRQVVDSDLATQGTGLGRFTYKMRLKRVLAKVIPDADRRAVAEKMVAHPQAVADSALHFMLRLTEADRNYLEHHKVPALQREVETLQRETMVLSGGAVSEPLRMQFEAKARALHGEASRLMRLQHLEQKLREFGRHLDTEFLRDKALATRWREMQVDFILAHDMVAESLSRKKFMRFARAGNESGLRDALAKRIEVRFARVFAQAYSDKVAYERRGALEVARVMSMQRRGAARTQGA
jgi:hypothetical protein